MGKHIGAIEIADELLLRWLDLNDGGVIRAVRKDNYNTVVFHIEHPDMPLIEEGDAIKTVSPVYVTTQDALGHKVTIRDRSQPIG